jgi:hypothetical protein
MEEAGPRCWGTEDVVQGASSEPCFTYPNWENSAVATRGVLRVVHLFGEPHLQVRDSP